MFNEFSNRAGLRCNNLIKGWVKKGIDRTVEDQLILVILLIEYKVIYKPNDISIFGINLIQIRQGTIETSMQSYCLLFAP